MNQHEAFKKLVFGAKFNFKRFRRDAERLKLVKGPDEKQAADNTEDRRENDEEHDLHPELFASERNHSDAEETAQEALTKRSSAIQLLRGVTISGEEITAEPLKKRKRKTKIPEDSPETKIQKLKEQEMATLRKKHRIYVWGTDCPSPCCSFDEIYAKIGTKLANNVKQLDFENPTSIQIQVIPLMLQRREVMACAPTGSGKTLAFVIPVLHELSQETSKMDRGERKTRALVVEPTRELARQVYQVFVNLSSSLGIRTHLVTSANRSETIMKRTKRQFDVLITTPSRLISLLNMESGACDISHVRWLIIDECDKLFETGKHGFRDQLAKIYQACDSVNVRRALFSATFSYELERWCKANLDNVLMVCIGSRNSAVETVRQELVFVGSEHGKLVAIRNLIATGITPPVLIFVQSKERAQELYKELLYDGINVDVIHADRSQLQRDNVVKSFRTGKIWVLICTELIGRGMDFRGVNLVINFDFPQSSISYIHRIGRTGRAGRPGRAITFFTESDGVLLRSIANVMREAGCVVPDYMLQLPKTPRAVKQMIKQQAPIRGHISTVAAPLPKQHNNKKK